jgi:hypothetical protein
MSVAKSSYHCHHYTYLSNAYYQTLKRSSHRATLSYSSDHSGCPFEMSHGWICTHDRGGGLLSRRSASILVINRLLSSFVVYILFGRSSLGILRSRCVVVSILSAKVRIVSCKHGMVVFGQCDDMYQPDPKVVRGPMPLSQVSLLHSN